MPHESAINDQHRYTRNTKLTKDEINRRYGATDDLNGANGRKLRSDRIHVEADIRDGAAITQAGGGN